MEKDSPSSGRSPAPRRAARPAALPPAAIFMEPALPPAEADDDPVPAQPRVRRTTGEAPNTEPAQSHGAEPAKAEPAKAEPAKAQPTKAQPTKAQPTKAQPTKAEPVKAQ